MIDGKNVLFFRCCFVKQSKVGKAKLYLYFLSSVCSKVQPKTHRNCNHRNRNKSDKIIVVLLIANLQSVCRWKMSFFSSNRNST